MGSDSQLTLGALMISFTTSSMVSSLQQVNRVFVGGSIMYVAWS